MSQHQENALGGHDDASRQPAPSTAGNTVSKLMRREVGGGMRGRPPPRPDAAFCAEKFRRFKLQEEFYVYADDTEHPAWMKIISHEDRSSNFSLESLQDLLWLLAEKDGRIRSDYGRSKSQMTPIIHNPESRIVSSMLTSPWAGYHMKALPLEIIRACDDWYDGVPVLGSRANSLPFLDDCNDIAVVYLSLSTEPFNHVYEMNTYTLVHSIIARKIHSMTARPGVLIVAYEFGDYLPIEVLSTENWRVLKRFNYSIPRCRELEYIKIFKESIFLKEWGRNMKIIDIWNHDNVNVIEQTKCKKTMLSFDLTAKKILLRFNNDIIVACNYFGDQVSLLEDNEMPGNSNVGYQLSDIYVTRDKSHAIYYSRKIIEKPRQGADGIQASSSTAGSINVYSTFRGKSIVNINTCNNDLDLTIARSKEGDNRTTNKQTSVDEALKDVTALFYDEKNHRIYTGSRRGFVHVWSH